MTPEESREFLNEVMAASARGKEEMLEYFDPEARFYEPEWLPYGGEYYGRERFVEFIKIFDETWSNVALDVRDILASETRAAIFGIATFTSRATGKSATFPMCEVWEFANRKIIRVDPIFGDAVAMLEALRPDSHPAPGGSN